MDDEFIRLGAELYQKAQKMRSTQCTEKHYKCDKKYRDKDPFYERCIFL